MKRFRGAFSALGCAVLVAACGGTNTESTPPNTSTAHGTLVENPPLRIASVDAATFQAQLGATATGQQLLAVTNNPTCGVDFYYLEFYTTGAAGEATKSSGALMVPTGPAGTCSGPRPIVLYAHGTQTLQTMNIANIEDTSNTEGALIAAMFAAQGYIVVAPNYAGYDISTLGYHPFLNAAQQSGEMMDILTAARTALPNTFAAATTDNGKLFITGYSEGGHVAMATQRAMQAAGQTVTAAAPMSGPYALEAFGDAIFFGNVDLGSTVFGPLIANSYQKAYGNLYTSPSDVFSSAYPNAVSILPSATPIDQIFSSGQLPQTALFNISTPTDPVPSNPPLSAVLAAALAVPDDPTNPDTPLFQAGFGTPGLITNDYRVAYAVDAATNPDGAVPTTTARAGAPLAATVPTQPLRKALYMNDMRVGPWAPMEPTLLCGGDQDPTVFYSPNTGTMAAFWSAEVSAGLVTVLDVGGTPAGPFAPIQTAFQASQVALLAYYESSAGGGLSASAAQLQVVENYHTNVAPFCALAARSFFAQF